MQFEKFGSIARLNKDAVYTEKINGTNAAVVIERYIPGETDRTDLVDVVSLDGVSYAVWAQSRNRFIKPGDDNFGFALWVYENAPELAQLLGEGRHYGEWWGSGIQGGYGLQKGEKRFSLFNVKRWETVLSHEHGHALVPALYRVPILTVEAFSTTTAKWCVESLREHGSMASPGFMKPEGVVVFHTASGTLFKTFLENDSVPKSLQEGHK
jgi:hypothetical protein